MTLICSTVEAALGEYAPLCQRRQSSNSPAHRTAGQRHRLVIIFLRSMHTMYDPHSTLPYNIISRSTLQLQRHWTTKVLLHVVRDARNGEEPGRPCEMGRHELASGKCLVWWVYKIPEFPLPELLHCHLSSTSFSISIYPSPSSPYHLRNCSLPQLSEAFPLSWLHLQPIPPKTNTPTHLPQQTTPTPSQPVPRSRSAP